MKPETKFEEMLKTLKQKGWTDEQLASLSEQAARAAFAQFYTQAVAVLTNEDLDAIEKCTTEDQANAKIKELYVLRTGANSDEDAKAFYNTFAEKFIEELEKDQTSIQTTQ